MSVGTRVSRLVTKENKKILLECPLNVSVFSVFAGYWTVGYLTQEKVGKSAANFGNCHQDDLPELLS